VGRPEPDDRRVGILLRSPGRRNPADAQVRLQRHVATLLGRDPCAGWPSPEHLGSVPHHGQDEQSHRRSPRRGGPTPESRWLRAGLEALTVVFAEAEGEPDLQADDQAAGIAPVQSQDGAGLLVTRRVPTVLELRVRDLGPQVPARVVYPDHAERPGAHEESRPFVTRT